ncbi:hypothetical protein FQA39_LY14302 [Lamprigera yunnana]|nr:hypothetical protein FQA39_LY14302 [Lamprigera yunnana]
MQSRTVKEFYHNLVECVIVQKPKRGEIRRMADAVGDVNVAFDENVCESMDVYEIFEQTLNYRYNVNSHNVLWIIHTAIKSKIDSVFKAMFDENPHLTRLTSMEAAFRHILNRTAKIESTAAITAHIFSILVAKFSKDILFKPEVIAYMGLPIDQMLEKTKKVEYESKTDRAENEGRASGDGERTGGAEEEGG